MKPESDWVIGQVEPVVTAEVWDECNRILDQTYSLQRRPTKQAVHVFAGVTECTCGNKMYVPSNSPKYVCKACRNKIAMVDLEAIFCNEIKDYAFAPAEIAAYLKKADDGLAEKEHLLAVQQAELQTVQREIKRVYQLYQESKLDTDGFGRFYKPLEERTKQLEDAIPRLEAEIDVGRVQNISAEEVAGEALKLAEHWPKLDSEEKRTIVESIVEKIVIGKGEISISLCYLPPCKEMAKGWRKGRDSNPR